MPIAPPILHRWEHEYSILSTVAFPHKKILFAGTQDSKILCFDLSTYSLIKTISLQTGTSDHEMENNKASVLCLSRSKNEKFLFAGGSDSLVRIWAIEVLENNTKCTSSVLNKTVTVDTVIDSNDNDSESAIIDEEVIITQNPVSKSGSGLIVTIINAEEVATIYSTLDIGDIFSIVYLDETQTVIFGTQRASLLYVSDIFNSSRYSKRYELLPHNRFDKFFDSTGPTGHLRQARGSRSSSLSNTDIESPMFKMRSDSCESLVHQGSSPSPALLQQHSIIEVPSKNIIPYAHNGFIYSLFKYENNLEDNQEYIVSGAGDGISKVWKLDQSTLELEFVFHLPVSSKSGNVAIVEEDSDDEYEDDIIFSQTVKFPFLYCGLNDGNVKIWDLNTKQLISTMKCGESVEDVTSICCWEDCIFAATKNTIVAFKGSQTLSWKAHNGTILSMSFLRPKCTKVNCIRLISGGSDGTLALWNIDATIKSLLPQSAFDQETDSRRGSGPRTSFSQGFVFFKGGNDNHADDHSLLANDHMLESLKTLIAFQTVSANVTCTSSILDSHSCATYLLKMFSKFGAATTKLIPVATGNKAPIVYAKFYANYDSPAEEKRDKEKNILWYGHYDVVAPGNDWKTDPFQMVSENGFLKGRGVSDNKGPLLAALYAVAELFSNNSLKHNICFVIEGQEENGSNGFIESLQQANVNMNEDIDSILLSNSYWLDDTTPCMNYGLRGVINMKITVSSDEPDRHSGVDGGIYQEPTTDLFQIVSKLIEGPKKVRIPDFYTTLEPIRDTEIMNFNDIIKRGKIATNVNELIDKWTKPSLSITTMKAGGNATVISKSAEVTVSIRIVPEQDLNTVKKNTTEYLQKNFDNLESPNHLSIELLNEAEPWLGNTGSKAYQILKNEIELVWGVEPFLVREGGSIATVRLLEQYFQAPAIQIPAGQSTDNAHLANEQLRILNLINLRKVVFNTINLL